MTDEIKRLPFNPQGNLEGAWVAEEPITVRPSTGEGFNFVVPKNAPYFRNGLKLYNPETNAYLEEGVDYLCTHPFKAMASLTGLELFGSLMLIDTEFSGNLQLSYYSLGGEFTLDAQQILNVLANNLLDPRETFWEKVADTPATFPPINHQHNVETDTMTWDDVVAAIESLKEPLAEGFNKAMAAVVSHERRQDNPHGVTKVQLNLGNVENFRVAEESDLDGEGNNLYMTLAITRKMIASLGGDNAAAHIANRDNPHHVTAEQVGLGNVQNFGVADDVATITGTSATLYTTPHGVAAAIKSVTDGIKGSIAALDLRYTDHAADMNNPHGVTKTQVGLGDVLNYGIASLQEAEEGSVNNKYMTPAMTAAAIDKLANGAINAHLSDTNNPHQVTKSQVGLGSVQNFGVATTNEAIDGLVNDKYMTPLLVRRAIEQLAGEGFAAHIVDYNNPHQVTKEQVGLEFVQNFGLATDEEAIDVDNVRKYMTPHSTFLAIQGLGALKDHTHDPLSIGALPLIGGTMTGPINFTSLIGTGVNIDGTTGRGLFNTVLSNGDIETYGALRGADDITLTDSDDETETVYELTGDIIGPQWVNVNSVDPVEDPDDPWPTDEDDNPIPPKKVGKLSDFLNTDFLAALETNATFKAVFVSLLKEALADFDSIIVANDFELRN